MQDRVWVSVVVRGGDVNIQQKDIGWFIFQGRFQVIPKAHGCGDFDLRVFFKTVDIPIHDGQVVIQDRHTYLFAHIRCSLLRLNQSSRKVISIQVDSSKISTNVYDICAPVY